MTASATSGDILTQKRRRHQGQPGDGIVHPRGSGEAAALGAASTFRKGGGRGTASATPGDIPTQETRRHRDSTRHPRRHPHSGEAAAPGAARRRHPPPQGLRRGGCTRGGIPTQERRRQRDAIRHPRGHPHSEELHKGRPHSGSKGTASATPGDIHSQERWLNQRQPGDGLRHSRRPCFHVSM